MIRNGKKLILLSLFFYTLTSYTPAIDALELILSVNITSEWVKGAVKAEALDTGRIVSSLEEGLTAEIIFQFRVYKISRGLFSFIGDRLVVEKKFSYIAFKDFFLNQYVIRESGTSFRYFETIDDFIDNYSIISGCYLIETGKINPYDYYILARVSSNPVKLEPPLHIIALFAPIGKTSRWAEYRFSGRGEGQY